MSLPVYGNVYPQAFIDHVHIHPHFNIPGDKPARRGVEAIKAGLVAELTKFNFKNVVSEIDSFGPGDIKALEKEIAYKKVFISVHHLGRAFNMEPSSEPQEDRHYIRPRLQQFEYADNGKRVQYSIQVIGLANTGKTAIANMLVKVLKTISPTTDVIIIDTDPYTVNFYYLDDAERKQFLANIAEQRHFNVGQPMLSGLPVRY